MAHQAVLSFFLADPPDVRKRKCPTAYPLTHEHPHAHTVPVTFSSGLPPCLGGGLRPRAGQGAIKDAPEFGLRMKMLWPQVTEGAAQADKAQWATPALLPLLSLLPAQCQLPSTAAPLKLSFGFCSRKPRALVEGDSRRGPGRGTTSLPWHSPRLPSPLSGADTA